MVTGQALAFAPNKEKFLDCDFNVEEPIVLQLGGSDPKICRQAARVAKSYGYKEINLNVGCPSDRVADAGCFGAALMAKPDLVAEIIVSMNDEMLIDASCRPCTVKCRIGIDDCDSYEYLVNFIQKIHSKAQVNHFIIHARKAILGGKLSPEQNRKIPPLKYDYVYRLIQDFPHIQFTINGGILSYEDISNHFSNGHVHGAMVGRQVINAPYYWRNIDSIIYNQEDPGKSFSLTKTKCISSELEIFNHRV
jgi:tRNA-dihydrouridine synthase A